MLIKAILIKAILIKAILISFITLIVFSNPECLETIGSIGVAVFMFFSYYALRLSLELSLEFNP